MRTTKLGLGAIAVAIALAATPQMAVAQQPPPDETADRAKRLLERLESIKGARGKVLEDYMKARDALRGRMRNGAPVEGRIDPLAPEIETRLNALVGQIDTKFKGWLDECITVLETRPTGPLPPPPADLVPPDMPGKERNPGNDEVMKQLLTLGAAALCIASPELIPIVMLFANGLGLGGDVEDQMRFLGAVEKRARGGQLTPEEDALFRKGVEDMLGGGGDQVLSLLDLFQGANSTEFQPQIADLKARAAVLRLPVEKLQAVRGVLASNGPVEELAEVLLIGTPLTFKNEAEKEGIRTMLAFVCGQNTQQFKKYWDALDHQFPVADGQ